jgi:hypothetical protein
MRRGAWQAVQIAYLRRIDQRFAVSTLRVNMKLR